MTIPLTCPCGQRQFVATEKAGGTTVCVSCGKALTIPAMGRLAAAKGRPKAKVPPRVPSRLWVPFAVAGLLIFAGGGLWLAWAIQRTGVEKPMAQVKRAEPEEPRLPLEHRLPEPKKEAPLLIEPIEQQAPPRQIVEPVVVKELAKVVVEPVQPRVEPKPALEPAKPKEPPVVEKKLPDVMEPLRLVWKLKEGDQFFQELMVTQKPIFKVQGLLVPSLLQYQIVSRFTVKKAGADGALVVEQKVVSARLVQADDLTKSTLGGAIAQLPGATYQLHLSPKMEVTKFEGAVGGVKIGGGDLGIGVQMASLIDRDGWKELAQTTFFQMDQPLKIDQRWAKPLTHNWGALGSWTGVANYAYLGQEGRLHKITYNLQLAYKAPAGGAIGLMTINGAQFQAREAGGALLFDAGKGRVVGAEERFRVKGVINANLLGQNTLIEIEEDQHFLMRIHDRAP